MELDDARPRYTKRMTLVLARIHRNHSVVRQAEVESHPHGHLRELEDQRMFGMGTSAAHTWM